MLMSGKDLSGSDIFSGWAVVVIEWCTSLMVCDWEIDTVKDVPPTLSLGRCDLGYWSRLRERRPTACRSCSSNDEKSRIESDGPGSWG